MRTMTTAIIWHVNKHNCPTINWFRRATHCGLSHLRRKHVVTGVKCESRIHHQSPASASTAPGKPNKCILCVWLMQFIVGDCSIATSSAD